MKDFDQELIKIYLDTLRDYPEVLDSDDLRRFWPSLSRDKVNQLFRCQSFPKIEGGGRNAIAKLNLVRWILTTGQTPN